jgi:hypothetical protein
MKRLSQWSFVVMCVAMVAFVACTAQQVKTTADTVQTAATAASSMLPSPFGVIAGLVAGAAGIVSSLAASHVKGGAVAAGVAPHPIADFLSSHSWIYPSIAAVVGLANSMGWIHVSPTELGTLAAAMGVTTGVQVIADGHAESKAPAPAPAPSTNPASADPTVKPA